MVWPEKLCEELLFMFATQRLLKRRAEVPRSLPRSVLGTIEVPLASLPVKVRASEAVLPNVTAPASVVAPTTWSLVLGELVPMPTASVEVVRRTAVPSSVQPETLRSDPEAVMVSFLLVVSGVTVMPVPPAKVSVSVLLPAEKLSLPTVIVLKIFWEVPRSLLVMVDPDTEMPVPAVRLTLIFEPDTDIPVPALRDVIPVLVIVGLLPLPTDIPVPAVNPLRMFSPMTLPLSSTSLVKTVSSLKVAGTLTLKTKLGLMVSAARTWGPERENEDAAGEDTAWGSTDGRTCVFWPLTWVNTEDKRRREPAEKPAAAKKRRVGCKFESVPVAPGLKFSTFIFASPF